MYVPREGTWEFTPLADDDPCLVVAQSPVPWEVSVAHADADGFTMSGVACVLDGEAYSCEAHEASTEAGGYGLEARVTYETWSEGTLTSAEALDHAMLVDYLSCTGDACGQIGPPFPCHAAFYAAGVAVGP